MPRMTQEQVNAYIARRLPQADGTADADLDDEGAFHERIMAYLKGIGVRGIVHSRMDQATTQARGVPDFLFAIDGVPLALEAKVRNRKPTPEQLGWLAALRLDGWHTAVVRSMADVETTVQQAKSGICTQSS